ncbi:hypothetical protein BN2475_510048 [Paraburkholderia ribeironis]|uniref:Uncharacterized protein n=1 Tax=Paraburkholderia ribeironis TaxID=1247936 RepID=A0A1N7SC78_9BURK|nr:hypothetical protein BN2475_510048 [Paraburkholderia ribeironis]
METFERALWHAPHHQGTVASAPAALPAPRPLVAPRTSHPPARKAHLSALCCRTAQADSARRLHTTLVDRVPDSASARASRGQSILRTRGRYGWRAATRSHAAAQPCAKRQPGRRTATLACSCRAADPPCAVFAVSEADSLLVRLLLLLRRPWWAFVLTVKLLALEPQRQIQRKRFGVTLHRVGHVGVVRASRYDLFSALPLKPKIDARLSLPALEPIVQ